jgi:hypothetical protein
MHDILIVDGKPACGVDDQDVVHLRNCVINRAPRDVDRVANSIAKLRSKNRNADTFAYDLQLIDSVRALQVSGDEERLVALRFQMARKLAGERRLAGSLQTREQDHRRRRLRQPEATRLTTEDRDEFLVDDLDDLLTWVQRAGDLRAHRAFLDPTAELPNNRQRDVGFEQRDPDFADGLVDIGLGEPTLAAQRLERCSEPVGQ